MAVQSILLPTVTSARHRFAYWTTAVSYVAMQAFSTLPSPLYGLYAERDHLSPLTITLVYAAYAAGVVVSLLSRPPDAARVSLLFDAQPPDAPAPATVELHPERGGMVEG